MTAQAVVFPELRRASVQEVEVPAPGDGDVPVEIEHSSISPGTERWCLTGGLVISGEAPLAFPHVPGYQAAGVVRQTGKAVRGLSAGDRVFSRNCAAPPGWQGSWWGGHVGLHLAPESAVIKLPAGSPPSRPLPCSSPRSGTTAPPSPRSSRATRPLSSGTAWWGCTRPRSCATAAPA